ncbi:MAG TPA: hypothetical protein VFU57_08820 [Candidatus Acidoferrales bacterium]|nr:hypothetical protein [Candidatus Acidoferrales bacterium]
MKVTRDVMNDLLPVYFSGEASTDTRVLVEEYFRENPEFERTARGAARPLETLQAAVAVAPEAAKEKWDLECVHKETRRNKVIFGLALFFTLVPLAFVYRNGHISWMMVRNEPFDAALYWGLGAVLWGTYFGRVRRRTFMLGMAIFFTLLPLFEFLQYRLSGGASLTAEGRVNMIWEATLFWGVAVISWFQYIARPRLRTASLIFAIFATVIPAPFVLYHVFTGSVTLSNLGGAVVIWVTAAIGWVRIFWLRRKGASHSESECS